VNEEVYETKIGLFKVRTDSEDENLVFVQTYLTLTSGGVWENLGWMKRKEFNNLIKSHNPLKKEIKINNVIEEMPALPNTSIQDILEEPDLISFQDIPKEPDLISFPPNTPMQPEEKGVKMIPTLSKILSNKKNLSTEELKILELCDGKHSIDEICAILQYPKLKVADIIRIHQKKKWIEVNRVIIL